MKLHARIAAALLLGTSMVATSAMAESLTRVVTIPVKAEVTGMLEIGNDFFFNIQHPDKELSTRFNKATVGVISNAKWDAGEQAVPASDEDKGVVKSSLGDYQIIVQEGDAGKIGVIKSIEGKELLISNDPDFNSFIPTGDNEGYLFTNWENRPGGMSRVKVMRDTDGKWTADLDASDMVDFSSVNGTWVNCFGTTSPWGTPLTSEELYFDDTIDWNNPEYKYIEDTKLLADYLGKYPNPYDYGYIIELMDPTGDVKPVKMHAMGRYSHENSVVMPDNKTVYLSDDGTGVVFFKFIADKAGDLSAGTLYAAKMTQKGEAQAEAADVSFGIEWVELAHGTNAEVAGWIREYDGITMADHKAGETNYISDAEVEAWAKGEAKDNRVAFLESRRAAVAKGATGEFRKMEGVNINYAGAKDGSVPYMYMSMSEVSKTMSDGEGDLDVKQNKCGVVYEMKLGADFNVSEMTPAVAGHGYDKEAKPNRCPVESISNPDNLFVRTDGSVVIGEDTSNHENNMVWLWKR